MITKLFKIITVSIVCLFMVSCSEDEEIRNLGENGFTTNSEFYVLNNASVDDENIVDATPSDISLTLSNVNLADSTAVSNITKLHLKFNGIALEEGTITAFSEYSIQIDGAYVQDAPDSETYTYVDGTFLLDSSQAGLNATETTITINSVTETEISLNFSFTRSDGQTFTGIYTGLYSDLSGT